MEDTLHKDDRRRIVTARKRRRTAMLKVAVIVCGLGAVLAWILLFYGR